MFSILLAQAEEVQKIVDHAANQSDRWLFLATVCVLALFQGIVIRYLVQDREKGRIEHANQLKEAYAYAEGARKDHAAAMEKMYGEQTRLAAQLLVALQENNQLIQRIEKLLDRQHPQ